MWFCSCIFGIEVRARRIFSLRLFYHIYLRSVSIISFAVCQPSNVMLSEACFCCSILHVPLLFALSLSLAFKGKFVCAHQNQKQSKFSSWQDLCLFRSRSLEIFLYIICARVLLFSIQRGRFVCCFFNLCYSTAFNIWHDFYDCVPVCVCVILVPFCFFLDLVIAPK